MPLSGFRVLYLARGSAATRSIAARMPCAFVGCMRRRTLRAEAAITIFTTPPMFAYSELGVNREISESRTFGAVVALQPTPPLEPEIGQHRAGVAEIPAQLGNDLEIHAVDARDEGRRQ